MRSVLAFLLLLSFAYGQNTQPNAIPAAPSREAEQAIVTGSSVALDDPVITVNGFCADPAKEGNSCKTVITRAQFETLTEALQPGMSPALRLKVANSYARNLRMSAAAEKRGLDKTPAFEEEMRYARMQLLSQDLSRALQAEANNISEAEFESYYKDHESSYEEATVARIFVPRSKESAAMPEGHQGARSGAIQADADEAAMTKAAADLRARAANGEDPDKLQVEAYTQAGFPGTVPHTKMEKVRRSTLPPQHERVMDLKPGEVSDVFSDPEGAHFIYKMLGKQTLALEDVRSEIRQSISSQRYSESMKAFQGDTVFSDAYFNPPGATASQHPGRKRIKAAAGKEESQ